MGGVNKNSCAPDLRWLGLSLFHQTEPIEQIHALMGRVQT